MKKGHNWGKTRGTWGTFTWKSAKGEGGCKRIPHVSCFVISFLFSRFLFFFKFFLDRKQLRYGQKSFGGRWKDEYGVKMTRGALLVFQVQRPVGQCANTQKKKTQSPQFFPSFVLIPLSIIMMDYSRYVPGMYIIRFPLPGRELGELGSSGWSACLIQRDFHHLHTIRWRHVKYSQQKRNKQFLIFFCIF